ncbi:hypothetical protein MNB_SV-6-681 [hydrothermal vent metagenome]|uniref:Uncharacterized protein n=1 Tax=hydrothermal vent metagenome TaxID=652676 RepID=A0A1W1BUA0_9ZZZZ
MNTQRVVRLFIFATSLLLAQTPCERPAFIKALTLSSTLKSLERYPDIKRNYQSLKGLCVDQISFKEGKYQWKMLLVTHPRQSKGPFWFLPHDNEQTAFASAIYATKRYGGGFLAVMANDRRYFEGQDPNRNFGNTVRTARNCKKQNYPAPIYSKVIFSIIDHYKYRSFPYLALHNNLDGKGSISILKESNNITNYRAYSHISKGSKGGLNDEDSLIYIAGTDKTPNRSKLNALLKKGINTRYERVDTNNNDCSLSNFVVLNRHSTNYYNIETQHGDLETQKRMIDMLMQLIK